jgi:hypothetical protein
VILLKLSPASNKRLEDRPTNNILAMVENHFFFLIRKSYKLARNPITIS